MFLAVRDRSALLYLLLCAFLGIGLWEDCRCTRKEVHSHDNPRSWTVTTYIAEPRFGICIHVVTVIQWQGLEEVCVE